MTRAPDPSRKVSAVRGDVTVICCACERIRTRDQSSRQVCCVCCLLLLSRTGRSVLSIDLTDKSDSTDPVFNEKPPRGPVILGVGSHFLSSRLGSWPRAPRQPAFLTQSTGCQSIPIVLSSSSSALLSLKVELLFPLNLQTPQLFSVIKRTICIQTQHNSQHS